MRLSYQRQQKEPSIVQKFEEYREKRQQLMKQPASSVRFPKAFLLKPKSLSFLEGKLAQTTKDIRPGIRNALPAISEKEKGILETNPVVPPIMKMKENHHNTMAAGHRLSMIRESTGSIASTRETTSSGKKSPRSGRKGSYAKYVTISTDVTYQDSAVEELQQTNASSSAIPSDSFTTDRRRSSTNDSRKDSIFNASIKVPEAPIEVIESDTTISYISYSYIAAKKENARSAHASEDRPALLRKFLGFGSLARDKSLSSKWGDTHYFTNSEKWRFAIRSILKMLNTFNHVASVYEYASHPDADTLFNLYKYHQEICLCSKVTFDC